MPHDQYNTVVRCSVCGALGRAITWRIVGNGADILETGRWEGGATSFDCDHSGELEIVEEIPYEWEPDDYM